MQIIVLLGISQLILLIKDQSLDKITQFKVLQCLVRQILLINDCNWSTFSKRKTCSDEKR